MAKAIEYDEDLLFSQKHTAKLLGILASSFARWPVKSVKRDGRTALYYWPDVLAHRDEINTKDDYNLTEERARLTKHQADKAEIEVELLKGNVIEGEIVERVWGDQVGAFRAKILSLPARMASQVASVEVDEAELLLRDVCHEALDELKDYEPRHYRSVGDKQEGGEDRSTAANADRKRVGRRSSKAKSGGKRGARKVADR